MSILVCDPIAEEGLKKLRAAGHEVVVKTGLTPEALVKEIAPCQAVVVRSATKITKAVVEAGENLKVVVRGGAGLDGIDAAACAARGVAVLNTPEAATVSVAEHALALMFAVAQGLGLSVAGKTLGLIGVGRIGAEVAVRARALGMRVLACRRDMNSAAPAGVELRGLDELLAASDFVSIHVPGGPETKDLLDAARFERMKKGAVLINCARGGIVNEAALVKALESGRLAGAAVDVFDEEPLRPDHPLLGLGNVVLTPHLGASTIEGQGRVGLAVAEKLLEHFPGD
ncbi:MAG: hydroxyacid dehydrogenase [Elusimicrobia bacterium]|nr:hydroxyacid dehydrogenase [Elusimicrobiota bacterium]